jgi:hypothetical protein
LNVKVGEAPTTTVVWDSRGSLYMLSFQSFPGISRTTRSVSLPYKNAQEKLSGAASGRVRALARKWLDIRLAALDALEALIKKSCQLMCIHNTFSLPHTSNG